MQMQKGGKKFCQFEEEKHLNALIQKYDIHPVCCDIGARLKGSNTARLVRECGFKGVFVEANAKNAIEILREFPDHNVIKGYANVSNIEMLVPDKCGVLSIDVDGNDYWLWGVLSKKPQIVIIEFGRKAKGATIAPYDAQSRKRMAGTSKDMMLILGKSKGYKVYAETGVNLIFIREDLQ